MQNQENIKSKILRLAAEDERIRAVLLNGSRANPNVKADKYQDFDLVFIVRNFEDFYKNRAWINQLGKPFLQQFPDEMILGKDEKENKVSNTFLTIFEDGNRIDLTLFPIEKLSSHFKRDSLTMIWIDKDNLFQENIPASDSDYHIQKPNLREFSEVSNEFWWTITNVAKGLKRGEIIYAKDMMENVTRPMFLQIIAWKIGLDFDFKISIGKSGKFAKNFLDTSFYDKILKTYSDAEIERNWEALFLMAKIFKEEQEKLADRLNFPMNREEANNSIAYMNRIR